MTEFSNKFGKVENDKFGVAGTGAENNSFGCTFDAAETSSFSNAGTAPENNSFGCRLGVTELVTESYCFGVCRNQSRNLHFQPSSNESAAQLQMICG
jgi:hypothetical protein